jgi:hypothetical protein
VHLNPGEPNVTSEAPKLVSLDLSSSGLDATIDAPAGAVVRRDPFWPGVRVKVPSLYGYELLVYQMDEDHPQIKADCKNAPNCELVSEAPDAIMVKWRDHDGDNYVVSVLVGPQLSCRTAQPEAQIASRALADSVLVTCRSLKQKRAT